MKCFDCRRELRDGERYIEDTASGFIGKDGDAAVDNILADIFGGKGHRIVFCENCTVEGGEYVFKTVRGGEDGES